MSCSTLNQAFVSLNVSMGSLPEGFCPSTMQDLANAIATRLIVTPNQAFSTFAIGSVEPTSNVGPWLKNCEEWFVFNDALGIYVPISKGGFDSVEVFDASDTFTVPDNIYKIKIEAWGAGGGGSNTAGGGQGGGGGGGGAYGLQIFSVIPGQSIAITVGSSGAGGAPGAAGTASTALTLSAGGGFGGLTSTGVGGVGGVGGTATGAVLSINGSNGSASAGNAAATDGGIGGGSPNGGGGGVASPTAAHTIGVTPGGGGAGGSNGLGTQGGGGGGGRVVVWF